MKGTIQKLKYRWARRDPSPDLCDNWKCKVLALDILFT